MSAAANPSDPRRPWWASPPPGAAEAEESDGGAHDEPPPPWGEHVHVDACQVCPVCSLLRIAGDVRPDLVHHLAEAAKHVTLAAKAILDAQARGWDRDAGLQHVPLDDE